MVEITKFNENIPDFIKRNIFRPITLGILVLVITGQVLVVLHIHHSKNVGNKLSIHYSDSHRNKNVTLKPIKLDQTKFEIHVLKPHKDMMKKFPKHPEMVIKKMLKEISKEANKTSQLHDQITVYKKALGVKDPVDTNGTSSTPKPWSLFSGRKRRSLLSDESSLSDCPAKSPLLVGPLSVQQENIDDSDTSSETFREWFGTSLEMGGAFRPSDCLAQQKVAVIVPYRDREDHLKVFLHHMHPILQRQLLDYRIFIIEQLSGEDFNRAALMNVGFVEALKMYDFDCFVFHDVDLVPEDDRNLYICPPNSPKQMSVAVNKWKYRLQYLNYFGGVTALSTGQFKKINGFANSFYGWGGEDDDLYHRIQDQNFQVYRSPANIARFFMLKHDKVDMNEDLTKMMEKSATNQLKGDGLSTLKYQKVDEKLFPLYTWIQAKLPPAPAKQPKSWFNNVGNSLWDGMSFAADGLAKKVAEGAVNLAAKTDENQEMKKNHVY